MGVKMTGRVTARAYAKRDPHFCSSGPIILDKINSSSNDHAHPFESHYRVTPKRPCNRRQYTILSYLKRWITQIWYGIMRRVKSMFSAQVNPDAHRSNVAKKPLSEMDSEIENAFWREGIQKAEKLQGGLASRASAGHWDPRYCGLGDHQGVCALYSAQLVSKTFSTDDSDLERYRKSQDHSPGLKNDESLPGRIDSPLSFDEEYNALYESTTVPRPLSGPGRTSGKHMDKCGTLAGDFVSPANKFKKENSGERFERCPKKISALRTKTKSPIDGRKANIDGEWVQTVCFGSVWYSRSELDTPVPVRQTTTNRTRPSSRIPRLCSQTKKSCPKH